MLRASANTRPETLCADVCFKCAIVMCSCLRHVSRCCASRNPNTCMPITKNHVRNRMQFTQSLGLLFSHASACEGNTDACHRISDTCLESLRGATASPHARAPMGLSRGDRLCQKKRASHLRTSSVQVEAHRGSVNSTNV